MEIEAEYRRRLTASADEFAQSQKTTQRMLVSLLAVLLLVGAVGVKVVYGWLPWRWMLAPLSAAVVIEPIWRRARRRMHRSMRLLDFYERSVGRVDGTPVQSGATGEAFRESGHLYERDLNVLGEDSLFGMLATTRTAVGQRGLARMLLQPVDAEQVRQRQEAVRELAPKLDLREKIALLGQSQFQDLPADKFDIWLDGEHKPFPAWVRFSLWLTVAAWVLLLVFGVWQQMDRTVLAHNLAAILTVQAAVALWLRDRVRVELEPAEHLMGQVAILRSGLKLLRESPADAERLQALQKQASGEDKALAELQRHLWKVEQRTNEWFYIPALLVCMGTHAAISLAAWKRRYAEPMRVWLGAWAEFEALLALATYAVEHEENVYPEVVVSPKALFEATDMKHPLLWRASAVANDVSLGHRAEFLLISGSNMAGKSTLLRAIGANVVLALAGAPVPASAMTLSALRVGASLAITDSLAEGKSKFLAEVERLRDLVALAKAHPANTLFLIDEILSGTNSADRRAAAEAVLRALVCEGAIGALSTHDLALAELAEMPELGGLNVHMASADEGDPLGFDYLLKNGVNRTTNAMAIVRLLGL